MTETQAQPRRRRRGGNRGRSRAASPEGTGQAGIRGRGPICIREGCPRKVRDEGRAACSYLCSVIVHKLSQAEQMCRATGDTEHWAAAVALNDALTEYYRSDLRIYRAAQSVGITDEQWQAIKRGQQQQGR